MSVVDRNLVLSILEELWPQRFKLDLDEIDGRFYWTVCRSDVIAGVRAILDDGDGEVLPSEGAMREQAQRIAEHLREMQTTIPRLSEWLSSGIAPRMREPIFSFGAIQLGSPFGDLPEDRMRQAVAQLWVFDGSWTGERVEAALRSRMDAYSRDRLPSVSERLLPNISPIPNEDRMGFWFKFRPAGQPVVRQRWFPLPDLDPLPLQVPVIDVVSIFPLPPKGLISSAYDRIVIGEHKWNQLLPGFDHAQEPRIALMTWAVGLLSRTGLSFHDANRMIEDVTGGECWGTQTRFYKARADLLKRVPEATSCLSSRNHE